MPDNAQLFAISDNRALIPNIPIPIITKSKFAELTGLDIGVVNSHVKRHYYPTITVGKRSMINLAKLWLICLESDTIPQKA